MHKEGKYLYRLDEVGKVVLLGLYTHGKAKTLSDYLKDAGITNDNSRQVEVAISLESLELIKEVTYRLPLEIRAELTPLGESLVRSLLKPKTSKVKNVIDKARKHFGSNMDYSMNV